MKSMPWQAYTRDLTIEEVKQRFRDKYGYEPKIVWQYWDWLAGPIEEDEKETNDEQGHANYVQS